MTFNTASVPEALPDTTACIFWLKNRRPSMWRDRRDPTEVQPLCPRQDLENVSTEELERRLEILRELQAIVENAREGDTNGQIGDCA